MNTYSEYIAGLNDLSLPELKEMNQIVKKIISEKRRTNILNNYQESVAEMNSDKLVFSSDVDAIMEQLN